MRSVWLLVASTALAGGYDKGFVVAEQGDAFQMKLKGAVFGRYEWVSAEDAAAEGGRDERQRFGLRAARLVMAGHAFTPRAQFKLHGDFAGASPKLLDALVDLEAVEGVLFVRVGQFKKPFGQQVFSGIPRLELTESGADVRAGPSGRDVGVMLHGSSKSPFEWGVGLFNGTGMGPTDDYSPAVAARVAYDHGGVSMYSEGDLKGGGPRFGAGLSGHYDLHATDDARPAAVTVGGDAVVKAYHAAVSGEVFDRRSVGAEGGDPKEDGRGFHVQASYTAFGWIGPAARFAAFTPDTGPNDTDQREIVVGANAYLFGHNLKLQADYTLLTKETGGEETTDRLLRAQVAMSF